MGMNRRNVLIGLGATAAGGGAVLGSGAFSQVEADRTVTLNTAGDGGALLQFSVDDSYNGLGSGSATGTQGEAVIEMNLEQINDDAVTTFEGALTITNDGSNPVDVTIDTTNLDGITFSPTNASLDTTDTGNSVSVDIEVDTTGTVDDGDVTITATDSS